MFPIHTQEGMIPKSSINLTEKIQKEIKKLLVLKFYVVYIYMI